MNLSFSPEETSAEIMTVQVRQEAATISLEVGAERSHSTAYLMGAINFDEETVLIQNPLKVFLGTDEFGVHAENEELSIFACGQTTGEAINDFVAALGATWVGLKDLPDSQLTADAADLRKALMFYIRTA